MNYQFERKPNIALITQPLGKGGKAGVSILRNYLQLIGSMVGQIYLITDDFPEINDENLHILSMKVFEAERSPLLIRILRFLWIQVKVCSRLLRVSSKVPIVIFHIGSDLYLLPMLLTKLLGKKMVRFVVGRHSHFARVGFGWQGVLLLPAFKAIENLSFLLADRINVLSETAIKTMGLDSHRQKISVSGAQYIDGAVFRVTKPFAERGLVGHIGGLDPRKGALNFAQAVPLVLRARNDISFLIAGPGSTEERERIRAALEACKVLSWVRLGDWIPAEDFPMCLNELKLLILASYEEGLPAVVQQAMACGAVPLTTSVGGLPDLVKDGQTGFIFPDNSPPSIANTIIRALSHPDLEQISQNAHNLIMREYSYERLVVGCREALYGLLKR